MATVSRRFCREFKAFRTLIITTSKERLQHMREATTRLPFRESHAKRFLWGTIQSWVRRETIFDPIWQSLDADDQTAYRIG